MQNFLLYSLDNLKLIFIAAVLASLIYLLLKEGFLGKLDLACSNNFLTKITYNNLYQDRQEYLNLIVNLIENEKFDLIITTKQAPAIYDESILSKTYEPVDELKINMPQTGQSWILVIWKPRQK